MNKKIAIITRRAGYNMGSSLQAYAIFRFLSKMGYNTTILDYDEAAKFVMWRIKPMIESIEYAILNFLPIVCIGMLKRKYMKLKIAEIQRQRFRIFEQQFMTLSKKKFRKLEDFVSERDQYDAYVCGSDQIWSPYMFDPVFYFGFLGKNEKNKTIAYAPSMGVNSTNDITTEQKDLMKEIAHISCREKVGSKLIEEITGRRTPVVLDPTLMLTANDWRQVMTEKHSCKNKGYILTYFLHTNAYEDNIPRNFLADLKRKTGLFVINIQMYKLTNVYNGDINIEDAGPQDFLHYISNASYICTNSFHCCVFSFIFKKRFYVTERFRKVSNSTEEQNSRIYTLLNMIGYEEALISNKTNIDEISIDINPDYSLGEQNIERKRQESIKYINNSLSY